MFAPSKMLLKYLNAQPRDMYDIVGALEGYINADPKFQTNDFDAAVDYVLKNGVTREELFKPFDAGIDFIEDESKWDYEYYSLARVYLKDNFCEKRINHVKAIARKLYPAVAANTRPASSNKPVPPKNSGQKATEHTQPVKTDSLKGGSQTTGKKTKDQPSKRRDGQITPNLRSVKIGGAILLCVVLVVVIVFILKK
ncbi:MAG: hypothetical protein LUE92_17390 [Clostridiales bacterium]|nr:hypothetical protein [Clostridiales bacterium]